MSWWERVRSFFVNSNFIHERGEGVESLEAFVELCDRFLDRSTRYDLEWDDFISWEAENGNVETMRQRLGAVEGLLFSKDPADRKRYRQEVCAARNESAKRLGAPQRECP